MTFGEKLQALRKKQGLSQEQLAEALGVSRQAISKWELNAAVPDVENIVKLSALLHVTTDYLMKADVQEEGDAVMQLRAQVEQLQEELRILSVKKEKRGVSAKLMSAIVLTLAGGGGILLLLLFYIGMGIGYSADTSFGHLQGFWAFLYAERLFWPFGGLCILGVGGALLWVYVMVNDL